MQVSGKGALWGFAADALTGAFPIGTLIGSLAKNLFNLDSGDMSRAYDAKSASKTSSFDTGDLKGMADGLFGKLNDFLDGLDTSRRPTSDETALSLARPRADEDATRDAQTKSSFGGWGKALLYGGLALGGLSLLNNLPFMGGFGMPFYGAGMGMGMMGMMNPMMGMGMMNPMMMGMGGMFW